MAHRVCALESSSYKKDFFLLWGCWYSPVFTVPTPHWNKNNAPDLKALSAISATERSHGTKNIYFWNLARAHNALLCCINTVICSRTLFTSNHKLLYFYHNYYSWKQYILEQKVLISDLQQHEVPLNINGCIARYIMHNYKFSCSCFSIVKTVFSIQNPT